MRMFDPVEGSPGKKEGRRMGESKGTGKRRKGVEKMDKRGRENVKAEPGRPGKMTAEYSSDRLKDRKNSRYYLVFLHL